MTDRERLLKLFDIYKMDSIEAILNCFLDVYKDDISARRIHGLIRDLNNHLGYKIENLEQIKFIANERATYLKKYLDGSMWKDEESAKENLQPQIDNAQAIIDICNNIDVCKSI